MINKTINNEDGMVLMLVLLLMAILSMVGLAANRNVATDTGISANHLDSRRSFYHAEAGLHRGMLEAADRLWINGWNDFSPLLDGSSATAVTNLMFGDTVSYKGGTFVVTVLNDRADPVAVTDTNRTITIRSTGTVAASQSILEATIRLNTLPNLPGAVNLVGDATVSLSGNSFLIDGTDHMADGAVPGLSADKLGLALCNTSQTPASIIDGMSAQQRDNVRSGGTYPSVGTDNTLTNAKVAEYVSALKDLADYKDVLTYGTVDAPKITYYSAGSISINPQESLDGAGVLIIDGHNNNLICNGNVHWVGVIIIVDGEFRFNGGGNGSNVTGGVIVGGISADTTEEADINGGITLRYSRDAINKVNNALTGNQGRWKVLSWRKVL